MHKTRRLTKVEIIKEEIKILELKNTMNKMKKALQSINIRTDEAKERTCELKDRK